MIDVGAGSGSLSATLCREILNLGLNPKFQFWFVDLEPADHIRFFRNSKLQDYLDNLTFLVDDYRSWLSKPQPLPQKLANSLRIAFITKLFNNLSNFSVRFISNGESSLFNKSMKSYSDKEEHRPSLCLAPGGQGVGHLAISTTRVKLPDGRTFPDMSLSEFYHGLYLLSKHDEVNLPIESGFYLPIRSFNPVCLETTGGESIISCLMKNCDYLIIEDTDLRPQDLIGHIIKFSLSFLTIYDMTKTMKLKGNYIYVICIKSAVEPPFSGKVIW